MERVQDSSLGRRKQTDEQVKEIENMVERGGREKWKHKDTGEER